MTIAEHRIMKRNEIEIDVKKCAPKPKVLFISERLKKNKTIGIVNESIFQVYHFVNIF